MVKTDNEGGPTAAPGAGASGGGQQIGQLSVLEVPGGNVHAWLEQYEVFCALNNVEEAKKVLLFLSYLSQAAYSILRESLLPDAPASKTYKELKEVIVQYVCPTPNFLMERYNFRERKQVAGESVQEYVVALRKLSEFCEFKETLNDALRDQLVWGVSDPNIKRKLLGDGGKLTFVECVKVAVSIETATKDACKLQGVPLNAVFQTGGKNMTSSGSRVTCWGCGKRGHTKTSCPVRSPVCKYCGVKGHLEEACFKKRKRSGNQINCMEEDLEELHLATLYSVEMEGGSVKPIILPLVVDGVKIPFLVDTGSPISAMSISDAQKFGIYGKLLPTNLQLKVYNGQPMSPAGVMKVKVNQDLHLTLFLFEEGGPPIVGREWLTRLQLLDPSMFTINQLSDVDFCRLLISN
uniref:CCHC-type domain-containing protein n=1 Tax=Cacopsylla melanoneura TaxID=428564 RepID=A0A8D8XFH8_9HEMI